MLGILEGKEQLGTAVPERIGAATLLRGMRISGVAKLLAGCLPDRSQQEMIINCLAIIGTRGKEHRVFDRGIWVTSQFNVGLEDLIEKVYASEEIKGLQFKWSRSGQGCQGWKRLNSRILGLSDMGRLRMT